MRDPAGTVIVGIGNADRGDDALGHHVARRLMARTEALIIESDGEPGALLDLLGRARRAFIIDAAEFGATPGTVLRLDAAVTPVPAILGSCSTHGLGIGAALELGRALGSLPSWCVLFAIQGASYELGADLSPAADVAAGEVAQAILRELGEG